MKRLGFAFAGMLLLLLTFTSCSTSESSEQEWSVLQDISFESALEQVLPQYKKITSEEAQDMMSESVIILDARTKEEYGEGHIENAVFLPYSEMQDRAKEVLKNKNQTILVYSQTNIKCEIAARKLLDLGYRDVYDFGSIRDWKGEIVGNWQYPFCYNYFGGELPEDIVMPIDVTTTMKVNKEMQEFTVHIAGNNIKRYGLSFDEDTYFIQFDENHIESITIVDGEGNLVQSMGGMDTQNTESKETLYGVSFEDWNFDGNLDIGLLVCTCEYSSSKSHYYWIWDDRVGQFVENKELMEISDWGDVLINEDDKCLDCFTRYGSDGCITKQYKYIDDKLVLVYSCEYLKETASDKEESYYRMHIIVSELNDGEMVVTEEYFE